MTCEKHEIRINLGTANFNKHKNKGYSFREFINNSKENQSTPNATKININYVPEENLLLCIDNGTSMRHKLIASFDIKRQSGHTIYHNWGEGLNDAIGSLINDENPRSMVYIYTWIDGAVDIGCMHSSGLMGSSANAELYHLGNNYFQNHTDKLVKDIKSQESYKKGYKITREDNEYAAYENLFDIFEKAKKYGKKSLSGTAIEIYHPDITFDDNNNILCEQDGTQTLSEFLTESYLPQSDDQKICKFSDLFGNIWNNRKFEIYINDKLIPSRQFRSPRINENPSELFTLFKEGTTEELGKLQIVQSINIISKDRNSWFCKFQKNKIPDQDGKYIFLFNDIIVCEKIYRGGLLINSGYPNMYFKQKYDDQNIRRAKSIYNYISKSISNIEPEKINIDGDKIPSHPLTDQIITYDTILKCCNQAHNDFADEDDNPSLLAPIEKFLMRFCLLPYHAYILPNNPKTQFGRMKDNFQPSNDLLQAANFAIGKWAYDNEIANQNFLEISNTEARNTSINSEDLMASESIAPQNVSNTNCITGPSTRQRKSNSTAAENVATNINNSPPTPHNQDTNKRKNRSDPKTPILENQNNKRHKSKSKQQNWINIKQTYQNNIIEAIEQVKLPNTNNNNEKEKLLNFKDKVIKNIDSQFIENQFIDNQLILRKRS